MRARLPQLPPTSPTGALEQGMLLNLSVAGWYQDGCTWARDWALPTLPTQQVGSCQVFDIGAGALQTRMGLNLGDTTPRRCPSFATCEPGKSCCIGRFAVGAYNSCAVKSDGTLWCFGSNVDGQLGRGTIDGGSASALPVLEQKGSEVVPLNGVIQALLGRSHGCARRNDGSLWCWGKNDLGQLGDGTTLTRTYPVPVTALTGGAAVEQAAAGGSFVCVRRTDGTLWCWGSNATGELGDGTTISRSSPVRVTALGTETVDLAAGSTYACARQADGRLWCWGDNGFGQLGDGTTLPRAAPAPVTALGTAVAQVSLGGGQSCARLGDGSVWCWGKNTYGQVGDGTTIDRYHPTPVTGLGTTAVELAVGGGHGCARHDDGSVSCWGFALQGQVGDGTTVLSRPLPVAVAGLGTTAAELGSGGTHSCARRTDGTLSCWGENLHGQLGDGTAGGSPIPTRALSLGCQCGDGVCSRSEIASRLRRRLLAGELRRWPLR
ncbi:MAG: hypothetical protein IPG96_21360, partial [Proteobacteria bacterium]|nr:hypothetical protein [Pseudomonadota bacterium]